MNTEQLRDVLTTQLSEVQKIRMNVVLAINEYCKDEQHLDYEGVVGVGSALEDGVNSLWFLATWIEDRLNENTELRKRNKSRYKKVRKAYGYTYP
ncbi:hypothetical protein SAMN04487977_101529 [Treponema bryantii]|uniref:Uncharacterized protein n=1 Tax=Treponema bryantii TaxID=163 RepID=A0A1H9AZP2_9SPIR|nr:hypothetical protein [Treponema bryantii]SEP82250.1 hypothetical protein SAMN04487977_101529 [Treponema bryantii]